MNEPVTIPVSDSIGSVSAEMMVPEKMAFLYVLAHGAGAGMKHPFMLKLATALAQVRIGTLRFNFPFVEKGSKRPDPPAVAEKTIYRAIETAHMLHPHTALLAGGKSFGGRMTSQLLARSPIAAVSGIVFVGFPLHAPGKPSVSRADHLSAISIPMLFLQGTRDALASIDLMEKVTDEAATATLEKFEGADHSFKAGKKDLIGPLADAIAQWADAI